MKWLLALPILLGTSLPAGAQENVTEEATSTTRKDQVYLVIKTAIRSIKGNSIAMQVIPMVSIQQCEEAGALITTSERFRVERSNEGFECITGSE